VYGGRTLLYIGLAGNGDSTFAKRVPAADHVFCRSNRDAARIEIYVGRLAGTVTPDSSTWKRHINLAERLLINAHEPIYNIQRNLASRESDLRHVHVLNWGRHCDLFPEVSGARYSSLFADPPGYHSYTTDEKTPMPTGPMPTLGL